MFQRKLLKITAAIIMLLAIIFIISQIPQLVNFFIGVFYLVILPLLLATFLYYLLRPSVRFLNKYLKNKNLAIVLTILAIVIATLSFGILGALIAVPVYVSVRESVKVLLAEKEKLEINI
jgi:predicted PurR-regulated permease PerM